MIKSLVVMLWRSLANLNKSVRDFIYKKAIYYILYDNKSKSFILKLNKVKFEVTSNNDLIITGFRFLEVDGELYFLDLKNKEAIAQIKDNYFKDQLSNSHLTDSEFIHTNKRIVKETYAETAETVR